ncbi:hypothetical protein GCK32_004488 [Trichostrongylus colubriformis]|uniref:SH2 domain-containing protein n=1 Tax=Trichostrongylus colubriformis TaxID=6319 RepID=A0AAN8IK85_TRICO
MSPGRAEATLETDGESHHHYASEPTRWTYPNSEITDPIYIRDDNSKTDFEPLPRIESENRITVDTRIEEHFIGIRSSEEAAALVKPDDFALYYKKEHDSDVGATIQLYLVHKNTRDEVYHFPVLRSCEDNGSKWWYVQIGNNKLQSFHQLSDLVRCYHLYRFTDARTGRMEVFPLWQGGIVDDYV